MKRNRLKFRISFVTWSAVEIKRSYITTPTEVSMHIMIDFMHEIDRAMTQP